MAQGDKRLALIIMAAGMGRRYGGLKQVEPIGPGGELIIDYSAFDALHAGFERVIFVVREEIEPAFRERFDPILSKRCDVAYVQQRLEDVPDGFTVPADRAKPWGTAQAVLACRDVVDGPFAVINADDFYGRSAFELLAQFLAGTTERPSSESAVVGYQLSHTLTEHGTVSRGICQLDEDGYLRSIVERKRVAQRDDGIAFTEDGEHWYAIERGALASMNAWGFGPDLFETFGKRFERFLAAGPSLADEFFIPSEVGAMVAEGSARVRVLQSEDTWFGVTYREDVPRTQAGIARLVDAGVYPAPLWGRD
jgi:choline kinase